MPGMPRDVPSCAVVPHRHTKIDGCSGACLNSWQVESLMQDYIIQPETGKKGRSFSAKCTALVVADTLWSSGSGDTIRPIWAQFVGTDSELRPFATNLKLGRKAEPSNGHKHSNAERLEFIKSAQYQVAWQREAEGSIVTLFHPDLFRLDPGMVDPEGAKFVMLVPYWWNDAQTLDVEDARASLFAAYLDRRTRCPLVADVAFYRRLLAAALDEGFAHSPGDRKIEYARGTFQASGLDDAGLDSAISFSAPHDRLEEFLAEQVSEHFANERAA